MQYKLSSRFFLSDQFTEKTYLRLPYFCRYTARFDLLNEVENGFRYESLLSGLAHYIVLLIFLFFHAFLFLFFHAPLTIVMLYRDFDPCMLYRDIDPFMGTFQRPHLLLDIYDGDFHEFIISLPQVFDPLSRHLSLFSQFCHCLSERSNLIGNGD
jgi:hypothetical protein